MKLIRLFRVNRATALTTTLGGIVVFTLGALAGSTLLVRSARPSTITLPGTYVHPEAHACRDQFPLLNPDAVCGGLGTIKKVGYKETQVTILQYIEAERRAGRISEGAMFFRDLKNGPSFGVNYLVEFAPASLIKLPIAFVFLAAADVDPGILQVRRKFTGTTASLEQRIIPGKTAVPHQPYAVSELLKMTISYSDNASFFALEHFLAETPAGANARLQTFKELGVMDPKDRVDATLSVRGYSSLFTTLYNSSFLTKEYSQLLLRWLAESDYEKGLRAGIPAEIPIAHKFGIRTESNTVRQLHDCGIVYFPGNPYTLCIMTRGSELHNLERAIGRIARIVHEEVTSRRLDQPPAEMSK